MQIVKTQKLNQFCVFTFYVLRFTFCVPAFYVLRFRVLRFAFLRFAFYDRSGPNKNRNIPMCVTAPRSGPNKNRNIPMPVDSRSRPLFPWVIVAGGGAAGEGGYYYGGLALPPCCRAACARARRSQPTRVWWSARVCRGGRGPNTPAGGGGDPTWIVDRTRPR